MLLCSCSVATDAPSGSHSLVPMAKYQVDLDQTPKERWLPLLEDYTGSVPLILEYFRSLVRTPLYSTIYTRCPVHLTLLGTMHHWAPASPFATACSSELISVCVAML